MGSERRQGAPTPTAEAVAGWDSGDELLYPEYRCSSGAGVDNLKVVRRMVESK